MNVLRTANLLNALVPISRFNKGEANKIFGEVKAGGIRIVMKNNVPECVLISPNDYQNMIEEYENALLLAAAEKRMVSKSKAISHEELMKKIGVTENDLDNIDVEFE
ncbi:type II toxin-antitoxin system Phd/YefM family antitoxin [Treponema maltophilum]